MTTRKRPVRQLARFCYPFAVFALCVQWALTVTGAQTNYENYNFTTFAGLPEAGRGWYDGSGNAARFFYLAGVATDTSGNIYTADIQNHTIRKISPSGAVTTVAGMAGVSGTNNGTGSAARFNQPAGIAVDSSGNVYVADTANHTIRKITPAGLVTTLAGLAGSPGTNNGTGTAARFNQPNGVAVDSSNNIYVGDTYNHVIRKITSAGEVTTLAGLAGTPGKSNGTGKAARFNYPGRLAVDSGGIIYVPDIENSTIRKITPAGAVTTLTGLAGTAGSTNGTGAAARFNNPAGITVDGNTNIYVGDAWNHLLRKITPAGVVTTLAGLAESVGSADGTGSAASFNFPAGITAGANGNLYLADVGNHTIRSITPAGLVTTIAGLAGTSGTNNGTGNGARFNSPNCAVADSGGNLYVADSGNHTIRKITPAGVVTTFAGLAGASGTNNGTGAAARFKNPARVAVDGGANVYVADSGNHTIRIVTPAGAVTTLAGLPGTFGTNDGTGGAARFNQPFGVAVDRDGNVIVADTFNHTIRKITPAGAVTTLAGTTGTSGNSDGSNNTARFNYPGAVAVNSNNEMFVVDYVGHTVRKITPAGMVTTLGGVPSTYGNTDGTGSAARFYQPFGVAVLGSDIFVADYSNHVIRKGTPALPDVPVVDPPGGAVDTLRQLDVANITTVSWSWTMIRYPADSSAQLSSSTARNPTFTPDVSDLYVLRFEGTDSSGRAASGILNVTSTAAQLRISSIGMTGNKVVINGNGGTPGGAFSVLTATNAALPIANWTVLPGGIFDGSGRFGYTNGVTPGTPVQVYSIRVP